VCVCDDLFRRELAGLEIKIAAADAGRARQAARRVVRGFQAQLARRIGVEQVGLQDAILDDDGAQRGQAFAVEGRAAEAARAVGSSMALSSTMVSVGAAICSPSLPARNDA
jgi:hypothetical protein